MSDFKAKMHKIRFPLSAGGPSQTPLGELTALPTPVAVFKGLLLREGRGDGEEGGEGREGKGKGKEKGKGRGGTKGGEGTEGEGPGHPKYFGIEPPLVPCNKTSVTTCYWRVSDIAVTPNSNAGGQLAVCTGECGSAGLVAPRLRRHWSVSEWRVFTSSRSVSGRDTLG